MYFQIFSWNFLVKVYILHQVVQGSELGFLLHLLKKESFQWDVSENLKCFTRTMHDFSCFWEAGNGKSYKFIYSNDESEKVCDLIRVRKENNMLLHACFFPPSDVLLYVETHIRVVETSTNSTVYHRTVSIEDQVLLDPPSNVSLHATEEVGQLQVVWNISSPKNIKVEYEIKYSSNSMPERNIQVKSVLTPGYRLQSLTPGEAGHVRIRARPKGYSVYGQWSAWSEVTTAMVPQSAIDIDLHCHTRDLLNLQCQWIEKDFIKDSRQVLHYKLDPSVCSCWQECTDMTSAAQCTFSEGKNSSIQVYLRSGLGPHGRIFYSETFTMNKSIKTDPPGKLSYMVDGTSLLIQWEPPLKELSPHLVYQVRYRSKDQSEWKVISLPSPKTNTSLHLQEGGQFYIQVQAKSSSSFHSGFWSEWSDSLRVNVASRTGILIAACIPFTLFILVTLLLALFVRYFRTIKQHLWPQVPNLDKVLQILLTDINKQYQGQTFVIKQCYEDAPASFVEIVSDKDAKTLTQLLPKLEAEKKTTSECVQTTDYVTLNADSNIPCLRSNEYVHGERKPMKTKTEMLPESFLCSCNRSSNFLSSTDILNYSYLLPTQCCEDSCLRDFRYTNLESTHFGVPTD